MLPHFLRFHPVPVKSRHDGWSPELQCRFILALARGDRPGAAAEAVRFARARRIADRRHSRGPVAPLPRSRESDVRAAAALRARLQASSDPPADRAAFDALLDRLYPSTASNPTKPTNTTDPTGGAWHVSES